MIITVVRVMNFVLPSFPGSDDGLIHSAMTKGQGEENVVEVSQAGLGFPVKEGKEKGIFKYPKFQKLQSN